MPPIEPGRKAPDFTLLDQDDAAFTLSEQACPIVLFFYPKDCTSGCTLEAQDFARLVPRFRKAGAEVVGVSILNTRSKRKFIEQAGLKGIRLLADDRLNTDGKPDPEMAQRYGVWAEKSMYGRKYMGLVRTTFLIGPDRKVIRRWDNVGVPGHAEEVLAAVKEAGWGPLPSRGRAAGSARAG